MKSRMIELRESYSRKHGKKLLQKTIADAIGVSNTHYSGLERGDKNLTTEHVIRLAKFYGVSADYLLGISDDISQDGTSYFNGRPITEEEKLKIRDLLEFEDWKRSNKR